MLKRLISVVMIIVMVMCLGSVASFAQTEDEEDPPQTTVLKTFCSLRGKVILRWKKALPRENVKKYLVYRSKKKNGRYKRVASVKKGYYKDKKVKQKKSYWYKIRLKLKGGKIRKEDYTDPVRQKSLKTVFVGDSTMESVPCYHVLPKKMMLTKIGISAYGFMNTVYPYFSIKGRPSTGIKKLLYKKPNRVFIMLGMNELYWISKKRTVSDIRSIVKRIKKKRPGTEIVVLAISPSGRHHVSQVPANSKIQKCNKLLKKMAKRQKVKYHDWTKVFKNSKGYLTSKYGEGDGCHWKPSGARAFVRAIERYASGKSK